MNNNNVNMNRILSDPRYVSNDQHNTINNINKTVSKSKITKKQQINQQSNNTNDMDLIDRQIKMSNLEKANEQINKDIKQTKPKINTFKILSFGKVNSRQDYLADVGLISPPYVITDQFQIIPFELISDKTMVNEIINLLNYEFGHEMQYSEDIINKTWTGANVFYVMTSTDKKKFYGTIAIDRKNFYPYISQLYIVEDERCRNLAKHLINFANRYIKSLNFTQSRLWCENKLIQYYNNLGWYYEGKQKDLNIMVFNL